MGAEEQDLLEFESKLGVALPADYRQFVKESDGMIEEMAEAYLDLWSFEDAVSIHVNNAYGLAETMRPLLLIGSDGGGELLAFDLRETPVRLVLVNAVGASWSDVAYQADSLTDLLAHLRSGGEFSFETDGSRAT